jgi:hypothetical protein
VETPSEKLINGYLVEIAKGYKVNWRPAGYDADESDGEGGLKVFRYGFSGPYLHSTS